MSDSTSARHFQRLYIVRFAFALVWAALLFGSAGSPGPLLTALVVLYPLADAIAVLVQRRVGGSPRSSRTPEWINIVFSAAAAIALGWASTVSIPAVLGVWGAWAIVSGVVQLLTAVARRGLGGHVPLVVSGALSVLAGAAFVLQSFSSAASAVGVGGYAVLGGIFFLTSGIRLAVLRRRDR